MFVAWERGACLCCPRRTRSHGPGPVHPRRRAHRLVLGRRPWASSSGSSACSSPGQLPAPAPEPVLRRAAAGGGRAGLGRRRAPARSSRTSTGPTEATIACTPTLGPRVAAARALHGVVPIGAPLPGMRAIVVDEELREVAARGRRRAADGRAAGQRRLLARRRADGGRVRRPTGRREVVTTGPETGCGGRWAATRSLPRAASTTRSRCSGTASSSVRSRRRCATRRASMPSSPSGWPLHADGRGGRRRLRRRPTRRRRSDAGARRGRLPDYMVPRELRVLAEIPLNANGKIDRGACSQPGGPVSRRRLTRSRRTLSRRVATGWRRSASRRRRAATTSTCARPASSTRSASSSWWSRSRTSSARSSTSTTWTPSELTVRRRARRRARARIRSRGRAVRAAS